MLDFEDALARLLAGAYPVRETEAVPTHAAAGRLLAQGLCSTIDVPPLDNTSMDGYALRCADVPASGTQLAVAQRIPAGSVGHVLAPGTAARIFTGAPLPAGADAVVMQELCALDGATVTINHVPHMGEWIRRRGEDIAAGAVILRAGQRLRAQDIGLAASIGRTDLAVRRRLRVAVLSTGDELVEPGLPAPPGKVYDANRYALVALLEQFGCEVVDLGIVADRRDAVRAALVEAAGLADAVVTSGGMSTGEEDHLRAALDGIGTLHFWRLAIRPGRPVALGSIGGKAFVGLPGNPVAMMVTCMRFARPLLLGLAGATPRPPLGFKVRSAQPLRKKHGRREWLRVRLETGPDGQSIAHRFPRDGAGILTSLVESDGLLELAEETTDIDAGALVDFLPFSELAA